MLQNGTIFSANYGYEKIDENESKAVIENVDILKGKLINVNMNDNVGYIRN